MPDESNAGVNTRPTSKTEAGRGRKYFEDMVWKEKKKRNGILRLANLPRKERLKLFSTILEEHKNELKKKL